jgi:protein-disulfide isomerase
MNHFIWVTAPDGRTVYVLANLIRTFTRHTDGTSTVMEYTDGSCCICATKPEQLESQLNKYYNDIILFMQKGGEL